MTTTAYLALLAGLVLLLTLSGAGFAAGVPAMLFLVNLRRGGSCHLGGVR